MTDLVGNAHLKSITQISFVSDRFGRANSALNLNGGYAQAPPGIYFDTPTFTITVWFLPKQVDYWSRILDFGSGQAQDNILVALSYERTNKTVFQIYDDATCLDKYNCKSSQAVPMDTWTFLAVTYDGTEMRMYLNGTLTSRVSLNFKLNSVVRTLNYIGKSNWIRNPDGYSASYLDDLRFYNLR